jgi:hypothetical protein
MKKNDMRGKIYIQAAIRTKNAFPFKEVVLGFSEFSVNEWTPIIFEFEYCKGSSKQDFGDILDASCKVINDQYGKTNVKFQSVFESWAGERIVIA